MTKEIYTYYSEKDSKYLKKAKIFYGLFITIFLLLIVQMFLYQLQSYFINFLLIIIVMFFLYKLVFFEFIFYVRKQNNFKRIELMKIFDINDSVLEFFTGDVYQQLYDYDFTILNKNDVYVLAKTELDNTINSLGLAVYSLDFVSEAVSPSVRELSNELSGYIANASYVKVILLVKDEFTKEELESLKYDSAVHKSTVVIGLEKSTKKLIYNYFLDGNELDVFLTDIFETDLTRQVPNS